MPTLLEVQRAVYRSLVEHDDEPAAVHIVADALAPAARLNIYRNTFIGGLRTALRLSYPAVHRLVGAEFFEAAARTFIETQPPRGAYLDEYGGGFPEFLAGFEPAASLVYLAGVARLEWAVSRALHAPDVQPLDLSRLSAIDPADRGRVVFVPHPSVGLVEADHPVDAIWRAVLAQNDAAMAAIDLGTGPAWLLVHRAETSVDVKSVNGPAWRFMAELCASQPIQAAMDSAPEVDAAISLAEHLVAGRFVGFQLIDPADKQRPAEAPA